MEKQRDFGLDMIRVLALLLVMTTHSVVLTGAYHYDGVNPVWLITMGAFYLSHSCVPLFLLLSGYLCGKKQLSRGYFGGIFQVLIPYLLISVLCLLDLRFRQGDTGLRLTTALYWLFSFQANGYGWYVEMYIGLFLLIPFLNLLYRHIPGPKWKLLLLGIGCALTLLPDVFTSFGTEQVRADILPDYFNVCYPITYYLLGLWLRENGEKPRPGTSLLLLGIGWLVPLGLCVLRSWRTGSYAGGDTLNSFGCLTTAMTALGLFGLLKGLRGNRVLKKLAGEFSLCSFEMYLLSYLTDGILYAHIHLAFPFMTVLTFLSSWVLARLLRLVTVPLTRYCKRAYGRLVGERVRA